MKYSALLRELGNVLGFDLTLSHDGICAVFFDEDEIGFEISEERMFIMAELGSSGGREDACLRMLQAANLGLETGFACVGIDEVHGQFTLCRVIDGDLTYPEFEKILTIFLGAVRYWKKWLSLPRDTSSLADDVQLPNLQGLRI